MQDWIRNLYSDPAMGRMGHDQRPDELDLGLGWLYYGLARSLRPETAVVIGSYRGFVPIVIGKAMQDSGHGELCFIDPSLVDDQWTDPERVRAHFASYQVHNIRHHRATTQEFIQSPAYEGLKNVGLLYVDGFHSEEQARFDHEAFLPKFTDEAIVLFHDSVRERGSRIYGEDRPYVHTVCRYMDQLRADPLYEVMTLPQGDGLTLVKRAP